MNTRHIPERWCAAIAAWETWASARYPATTIRTRREHLQHLARTVGNPDPWAVTGTQLLTWAGAQPWAQETRRSRRTTLRGFYAWARAAGHVEGSPAESLPPVPPTRPNPMPAPDSVVEAALREGDERLALMVTLMGDHGLRRGEVAVVHSDDLVADLDGWSLVVHGKGGRDRMIPLTREASTALRALPRGWAFPGRDGGHLSARWVGKLLARAMPGHWTGHKLRHRAGTLWHEETGDLLVTAELLGHSDPKVTRAYVRINRKRLRDTVEAAARGRIEEGAA